jgi:DNA-directed RNA polymerase specialized sigma24 family protein
LCIFEHRIPVMLKLSLTGRNRKADVYNKFGRKLYGYAITKWKVTEDDAWDLIYKTIDKVVETEKRYTFASEEKFGSFVFTIFINYLRNHHRDHVLKQPVTVPLGEATQPSDHDQENGGDSEDHESILMKLLKEELDKLEDWQRILMLMRAQDYSYEEIEAMIGKPPASQLKVYYLRYKQKLMERINERIKTTI